MSGEHEFRVGWGRDIVFWGRSFALVGSGILLGFGVGTALPHTGVFLAGTPVVPEELVLEGNEADKAVAAAEVDLKQTSLPSITKALLAGRLEIAKTKSALLQQRITAGLPVKDN